MLGQNISDNRLDSYSDHSISAYRDFKIQKVTASLNLEVLNLMNRNYEIVKNFPMPKIGKSDDRSQVLGNRY